MTGGGVWGAGEMVKVNFQASAFPGYVFLNWSENGEPVSDSTDYSFMSSTSRALMANFIAQPSLIGAMGAGGVITFSWPAGAIGWVLQ